ncbi:MAG: four helix bundle protein [Candidatus Altimarinota bacterium]
MAIYENLPVYKTSYDLIILVFQTIKLFPKEYKYSLGDKIKNETIDLISNIYKANLVKDKKEIIENARGNIEIVRLYIRISKDLKIINLSKFIDLNLLIESISKQLFAWGKSFS